MIFVCPAAFQDSSPMLAISSVIVAHLLVLVVTSQPSTASPAFPAPICTTVDALAAALLALISLMQPPIIVMLAVAIA